MSVERGKLLLAATSCVPVAGGLFFAGRLKHPEIAVQLMLVTSEVRPHHYES
jgi:hypothetical protein